MLVKKKKMEVKTIGNSFNRLYRKWIRALNCLNGVHSGINLCHRIHPCWYQPSRNVYIPEQKPAGPKYTSAQNDDVKMSHTPHRYFKPYNFQTGLTFPSLPTSQITSLFPLHDSSPLLTTFSPPSHLIPSCLFWLLNISQYVLIIPFPMWFLLWRPPWPLGNSLLTGRAGSLEYCKLPTHCQGGRSFWISNLIIHSSQVPSASCLVCKASHGTYISSLNPTATARQCLSLPPDLLPSLWLKSILSHVLPLPPQILLPSSNPKNPCAIPSRIILQGLPWWRSG